MIYGVKFVIFLCGTNRLLELRVAMLDNLIAAARNISLVLPEEEALPKRISIKRNTV